MLARSLVADLSRSTKRARRCAARRSPVARPQPRRTRCSPRSPRRRSDREHAAAELDTAITLVRRARRAKASRPTSGCTRAPPSSRSRARTLLDQRGPRAAGDRRLGARARSRAAARADDRARCRAHDAVARARSRRPSAAGSTRCSRRGHRPLERAALLVQRADVRRRERAPDLAAAIARSARGDRADRGVEPRGDATRGAARISSRPSCSRRAATSARARRRSTALASDGRAQRSDRVEVETAAAAAWLAADEPAAALPHGARAHAELVPDVPAALRREVLTTLGEAAWRQRAWPDVIRAYRGLVDDPDTESRRASARSATGSRSPADRTRRCEARDRRAAAARRSHRMQHAGADADAAARPRRRCAARRCGCTPISRSAPAISRAPRPRSRDSRASRSSRSPSARADAMYRAGELFRRAERARRRGPLPRRRAADLRHAPARARRARARVARARRPRARRVILGRKVAATARHPQRQKPLLSRLGDLQDQLGRPDVALATHQRALEIDPTWRPSLRYVTSRLRDDGAVVAAAGGFAQLAGELPGDSGVDLAIVVARAAARRAGARRARRVARRRAARRGALGRAARARTRALDADADPPTSRPALARLRGEPAPRTRCRQRGEHAERPREGCTGRRAVAARCRQARARRRQARRDASPRSRPRTTCRPATSDLLVELVELATELGDHEAARGTSRRSPSSQTGARRGDTLLAARRHLLRQARGRARRTRRDAGSRRGVRVRCRAATRRCACSRSEAASHLAWDVAVEALTAIDARAPHDVRRRVARERARPRGQSRRCDHDRSRTRPRQASSTTADCSCARCAASSRARPRSRARSTSVPRQRPIATPTSCAKRPRAVALDRQRRRRADECRARHGHRAGRGADCSLRPSGARSCSPRTARTPTIPARSSRCSRTTASASPSRAASSSRRRGRRRGPRAGDRAPRARADRTQASAIRSAPRRCGRRRIGSIRATRRCGCRSPTRSPRPTRSSSRASSTSRSPIRTSSTSTPRAGPRARRGARPRRLRRVGRDRRSAATDRPSPPAKLDRARALAEQEDWTPRSRWPNASPQQDPNDTEALELLEQLYLEAGDVTAASEAIGRQLMLAEDPELKARAVAPPREALSRHARPRRRGVPLPQGSARVLARRSRDRVPAAHRRDGARRVGARRVALYREIAAAPDPRERGALHLELALIFEERLDDADAGAGQLRAGARVRSDDSRGEGTARAPLRSDRPPLRCRAALQRGRRQRRAPPIAPRCSQAAARNRAAAAANAGNIGASRAQLERAEAAGDRDAALDLAHQLWRAEPGHAAAFRVLAERAPRVGRSRRAHRADHDAREPRERPTKSARARGSRSRASPRSSASSTRPRARTTSR